MADLDKTINDLEEIEANMTFYKHPESAKVVRDAIELLKEMKEQQQEWIPVDERLPEEDGFYLVCNRGFLPWIAELRTFMGMRGWCNGANMPVVKMWMPLPKTPKDGEQE